LRREPGKEILKKKLEIYQECIEGAAVLFAKETEGHRRQIRFICLPRVICYQI
jgi:hypothetical protein